MDRSKLKLMVRNLELLVDDIKAEVYDNNGTLLPSPVTVNFRLEPILEGTYLNNPGQTSVNVETVNGIATVSLNSGSQPGPVRVIATANTEATSICDTLNDELESIFVPVVIASGEPHYIVAEWDPLGTEIIGLIDNMSFFKGDDGKKYNIFGEGGVEKTAKQFDKKFLGQIPISTQLRESADLGLPLTYKEPNHEISKIFLEIAKKVMQDVG